MPKPYVISKPCVSTPSECGNRSTIASLLTSQDPNRNPFCSFPVSAIAYVRDRVYRVRLCEGMIMDKMETRRTDAAPAIVV